MKIVNYISYNAGNVISLKNSLVKLNFKINEVKQPKDIINDYPIVIPGVGNYGHCVSQLKKLGLYDFFKNNLNINVKVIGICVGMQIMFSESEESASIKGLDIFKGRIVNLKKKGLKKSPSIGWFKTYDRKKYLNKFYFIHSFGYLANDDNDNIYYKKDNLRITAVIKKKNYIGLQFHPEKSGEQGLKLLNEYLNK